MRSWQREHATIAGLERIVRTFLNAKDTMGMMTGSEPSFNNTVFEVSCDT